MTDCEDDERSKVRPNRREIEPVLIFESQTEYKN